RPAIKDCQIARFGTNPYSSSLTAFTGEGKLVQKATGYEQGKAEAALSHIGFAGYATRASGAHWSVPVTHRFLRRGIGKGSPMGVMLRRPAFLGSAFNRGSRRTSAKFGDVRKSLTIAGSPGVATRMQGKARFAIKTTKCLSARF